MKKGISLVVLVITIIIMIILAGAAILNLNENNPIMQANKAAYLSDLKNFETELDIYEIQQSTKRIRSYNPLLLQADEISVTYDGIIDTSKTINDLIPSLGKTPKYAGQFAVVDGKLVYQGLDTNIQSWTIEFGTEVVIAGEPTVAIIQPSEAVVKQGTDVVYTIKFTSNASLATVNLTGKVEVLDDSNIALSTQPNITIGETSGTSADVTRQVDVAVDTSALANGTYKLKIKSGAVTNINGISNTTDKISSAGFDVDNIVPENPVMLASPTTPTNGSVAITITYSQDTVIKEYSFDSINWNKYTVPVVVSINNTIVYARGKDLAGNESGLATLTVANIDKIGPTVTYGTNGGNNLTEVSTTVTVTDESEVNTSTLEYVWDTQNSTTPSSGWNTFTNGAILTKTGDGSYYLWIKANDNLGNNGTTVSNKFIVGEVPEEIVSTVQSVNKTFSGATSGYSYNDPVIPAGFVAVNTTDANWYNLSTDFDKGLIIQDASGNQFVWVPVDGTNVPYAKWCTKGIAYNSSSIADDTTPSGFSVTKITTTYKGFYIARYESMFDYNGGSIRAASKKSTNKQASDWAGTRNATYDGYLWNYINYTDSKTYAENMDTSYSYDTTKVGTNLITGAEWDTVMKWIQNSGISVIDSITWGNYSDSASPANISGYGSLQISGYNNNWKAKNIYDLAGNAYEWTNEKWSDYRVNRGGAYTIGGSNRSAAYRSVSNSTIYSDDLSFRVALYIL